MNPTLPIVENIPVIWKQRLNDLGEQIESIEQQAEKKVDHELQKTVELIELRNKCFEELKQLINTNREAIAAAITHNPNAFDEELAAVTRRLCREILFDELVESEPLSRNQRWAINAQLTVFRNQIAKNIPNGYQLLAAWIDSPEAKNLSLADLELTVEELKALQPFIHRVNFIGFDFSNWSVQDICDYIENCRSMDALLIDDKKIVQLPDNCTHLKYLYCSGTHLESLCDLPEVKYLDCSGTPLKKLSENMSKLEVLLCHNCPHLEPLAAEFSALRDLTADPGILARLPQGLKDRSIRGQLQFSIS